MFDIRISGMWDSNSRPLGPKPSALAIWANSRLIIVMVGVGGLEPPTSSLSETRSNQLSYTPIIPKIQWIKYLYTQSNQYTHSDNKCKTFLFFHTKVVPGGGIEPPTRWFSVICSTNWAILAYCNINPQSFIQ